MKLKTPPAKKKRLRKAKKRILKVWVERETNFTDFLENDINCS
jgi:hypothetical protein